MTHPFTNNDDLRAAYDLAIEHVKEAAKERIADMIHRKGEGFLAVQCAYFLDNVIHKVSPQEES